MFSQETSATVGNPTGSKFGSNGFQLSLGFGKIAESAIAKYLTQKKGYSVLPIYEIEHPHGKGPRLSSPNGDLIAPDMFVFKGGGAIWVEAKHKNKFTWHGKSQKWTTGIDRKYYGDYLLINDRLNYPVWLMFLHRSSTPDAADLRYGCEEKECPTGLYGGELDYLRERINHQSPDYGKGGMVYWAEDRLRRIADLAELA